MELEKEEGKIAKKRKRADGAAAAKKAKVGRGRGRGRGRGARGGEELEEQQKLPGHDDDEAKEALEQPLKRRTSRLERLSKPKASARAPGVQDDKGSKKGPRSSKAMEALKDLVNVALPQLTVPDVKTFSKMNCDRFQNLFICKFLPRPRPIYVFFVSAPYNIYIYIYINIYICIYVYIYIYTKL